MIYGLQLLWIKVSSPFILISFLLIASHIRSCLLLQTSGQLVVFYIVSIAVRYKFIAVITFTVGICYLEFSAKGKRHNKRYLSRCFCPVVFWRLYLCLLPARIIFINIHIHVNCTNRGSGPLSTQRSCYVWLLSRRSISMNNWTVMNVSCAQTIICLKHLFVCCERTWIRPHWPLLSVRSSYFTDDEHQKWQ